MRDESIETEDCQFARSGLSTKMTIENFEKQLIEGNIDIFNLVKNAI